MEAQQATNSEENNSTNRLPFDVEFFNLVENFSNKALGRLPELHGVAVVPIWLNQPENSPPGLLRLRDATPPYMASLLRLLARLAAFNVEINKDLVNQIKMFDAYAAQLAETIKERTEALNNTQQPENATPNE